MNKTIISILLGLIIFPLFLPLFSYISTGQDVHLNDDMMQEYLRHGIFRHSMLEYKRFPLWSPYIGGGYPLYAHPHDASMILPLGLSVLLFGEVVGIKINILIIYLCGIFGMYFYAKKIFSPYKYAVFLSTLIYAVSPYFLRTVYDGNYNELFVFMFPAILFLYEKGKINSVWLLISSLLMVSLVFFGKFYLLYSLLILFFFVFIDIIRINKKEKTVNYKPLIYFGIFISLLACFSLVKLVPMYNLIMKTIFFETRTTAEYFKLKYFYILVTFLISLSIGKGYILLIQFLKKYLHPRTKVFAIIKLSCIFLVLFFLYNAFFETQALSKQPGARYLEFRVLEPPVQTEEFYQTNTLGMNRDTPRTEHSQEYLNFRRGIGTIDWYDGGITIKTNLTCKSIKPPCSDASSLPLSSLPAAYPNVQPKYFITETDDQILNPEYKGEVYIIEGEGEITNFKVEPNRLKVFFTANSPLTIVINQNYDSDWKSNKGIIQNYNGLLSIKTEILGNDELLLVYSPKIFYISLFISVISLILAVYLLCYNKKLINFICYLKT